MTAEAQFGTYFWRGGKRIEVEREKEYFSAIVKDEAELERVRALSGVSEVKHVFQGVHKVRITAGQRDVAMERFRSDEMQGVCHHAYRPKNATATRYYLTDQIVVKFRADVAAKTIEAILAEAGVGIIKDYGPDFRTYLLRVFRNAGMNPLKVANVLAERKEVEYAEPNLINRFQRFYTPTDTRFPDQWHLQAREAPDVVADADVSAPAAWEVTRGRREVVVAVMDDGFDTTHPDFTGDGKIVFPKDYVDGDSNPFPVTAHDDYHGTPCAGVAVAEENGLGVVGIAPGCAFMPVRFDIGGSDDNLLTEIFDFVGQRADVISCSWGPPPVNAPLSQVLTDKIAELAASGGPRKKGCVIVFAAGNYNAPLIDPNNTGFTWRHPFYGLYTTQGPIFNGNAAHPDVIAVSSATSMNRKAAYSNWGAEIAVAAPSDNFHPLDRFVSVPGRGISTTDNEAFGTDFTPGERYTEGFGGTSSATPLVAGVAALVISANPSLTAKQVKQILQETADKIVDNRPDPVLGNTKGTYDANGHSEWFGYGRVNAAAAVQRAVALRTEETGATELVMKASANGSLADTKDMKFYKISVKDKLTVRLEGPLGEDFDLYVKRGSQPTTSDYDARGYTSSSNEKIVVQPVEDGDYYVAVRSYRGSGDYKLEIEHE